MEASHDESRRVALRSLALMTTTIALSACGGGSDSSPAPGPSPVPTPPPPSPPPAPTRTYTDDYPAELRALSPNNEDYWDFFCRECTSFAAWRLNRDRPVAIGAAFFVNGKYPNVPTLNALPGQPAGRFSNAGYWHRRAMSFGVRVDNNPAIGAIAHWAPGELGSVGHVAYVERVNSDNSVDVTEYNKSEDHQFGFRTDITAPRYIHFESWPIIAASIQSGLYWVETSGLGRDELVGFVTLSNGSLLSLTDVVLTTQGVLYAITFSTLYRLDPHTALATQIGSGLGFSNVNALGSDLTGNLYGATTTGQFLTIDQQTGIATLVGNFGSGLISHGDIEFSPAGFAYATVLSSSTNSALAQVDATTGSATKTGFDTGFPDIFSLTFVGERLFGLSTDEFGRGILVQISTAIGLAVSVRSVSFAAR